MPKPDQTLYDVLGVKPDAKHHEIGILKFYRFNSLGRVKWCCSSTTQWPRRDCGFFF